MFFFLSGVSLVWMLMIEYLFIGILNGAIWVKVDSSMLMNPGSLFRYIL